MMNKNHYQNILLIDDDRLFILTYHKIFSNLTKQATIDFSMSTSTGLSKLEDMHESGIFPELITLDWKLKMGGGRLFLEKYQKLYANKYPKTKIVVISDLAQEIESQQDANFPFVSAILAKPVSMQELSKTL